MVKHRTRTRVVGVPPRHSPQRIASTEGVLRGYPQLSPSQYITGVVSSFDGRRHFGGRNDSDDGFLKWFKHLQNQEGYIPNFAGKHEFLVNHTAKKAVYTKILCLLSKNQPARMTSEQGKPRGSRRPIESHPAHTTVRNGYSSIVALLNKEGYKDFTVASVLRKDFHCTAVFCDAEHSSGKAKYRTSKPLQQHMLWGYFSRTTERWVYTRTNITPKICDYYSWEELVKFTSNTSSYPFNQTLIPHKLRGVPTAKNRKKSTKKI